MMRGRRAEVLRIEHAECRRLCKLSAAGRHQLYNPMVMIVLPYSW